MALAGPQATARRPRRSVHQPDQRLRARPRDRAAHSSTLSRADLLRSALAAVGGTTGWAEDPAAAAESRGLDALLRLRPGERGRNGHDGAGSDGTRGNRIRQ